MAQHQVFIITRNQEQQQQLLQRQRARAEQRQQEGAQEQALQLVDSKEMVGQEEAASVLASRRPCNVPVS